jgi:positive regulator of sigma E activity
MARGDLDIKMKIAYREFKRRIVIYFSLMLLAFIAVISFIVYGLFFHYTGLVKVWTAIVIFLLFLKLGFDAIEDMKRQFKEFKEENDVTDRMLRGL